MRDAIRSRKKDQLINFSVEKRDATQRVIEISYSSICLVAFLISYGMNECDLINENENFVNSKFKC